MTVSWRTLELIWKAQGKYFWRLQKTHSQVSPNQRMGHNEGDGSDRLSCGVMKISSVREAESHIGGGGGGREEVKDEVKRKGIIRKSEKMAGYVCHFSSRAIWLAVLGVWCTGGTRVWKCYCSRDGEVQTISIFRSNLVAFRVALSAQVAKETVVDGTSTPHPQIPCKAPSEIRQVLPSFPERSAQQRKDR